MSDLTMPNALPSAPRPGAVSALAVADQQRAIAEVHAAITLARANPRDEQRALDRIINACSRPTLAELGTYLYTRGGQEISGPSIRLAETVAQSWGNIQFGFRELSRGLDPDGVTYSEVEAFAWDVEHNSRRPVSFRVRHWRDTKKGGYKLTDERDIYELVANQAQRRVRSCITAIIPGDIFDSAVRQCDLTLKTKIEVTPDLIKSLVEKFDGLGVSRLMIEKRIQRNMDSITPAQVAGLGKVFNAIRDGVAVVSDYFEIEEVAALPKPDGSEPANRSDAAKAKVRARQSEKSPHGQATAGQGGDKGAADVPTYAQVADALHKAATLDALDLAADLINGIKNESHQDELRGMYRARAEELSPDVPQ